MMKIEYSPLRRVVGRDVQEVYGKTLVVLEPGWIENKETPDSFKKYTYNAHNFYPREFGSTSGLPVTIESVSNVSGSVLVEGNRFRTEYGQSGGRCDVTVRCDDDVFLFKEQYSSRSFPKPKVELVNYKPGSLAAHMTDQIKAAVSGKTPSDGTRARWTSVAYDYNAPVAVLNTNAWTAQWDFSCAAICRLSNANASLGGTHPIFAFAPVLISPRHAFYNHHITASVGMRVLFRGTNGSIHVAVVQSVSSTSSSDIGVMYFTAPVPDVVKPAITLPVGYEKYLPSSVINNYNDTHIVTGIPSVIRGARKGDYTAMDLWKLGFASSVESPFGSSFYSNMSRTSSGNSGKVAMGDYLNTLDVWCEGIHGGDSNSPSFWIINGQPVLLCTQWTVNGAVSIIGYKTDIENRMNALAGTTNVYKLQTVDLSGFPKFS